LQVGDIVRLEDKEHVPADIIILATDQLNGEAYCSTATLDGERTLKSKEAI
jgi:P-type E1-E2 ATPase